VLCFSLNDIDIVYHWVKFTLFNFQFSSYFFHVLPSFSQNSSIIFPSSLDWLKGTSTENPVGFHQQ
jgi:hypothetical protein